jgi:hypothetical protein
MPNNPPLPAPTLVFSYGTGLFGRTVECYRIGEEFFLYGVTQHGDARVLPSIGMAREVAASAIP